MLGPKFRDIIPLQICKELTNKLVRYVIPADPISNVPSAISSVSSSSVLTQDLFSFPGL